MADPGLEVPRVPKPVFFVPQLAAYTGGHALHLSEPSTPAVRPL